MAVNIVIYWLIIEGLYMGFFAYCILHTIPVNVPVTYNAEILNPRH